MKISILQENLSTGLSLTSRFVSTKTQLPILSNILLKAEKGKLLLSATNLETGVAIWLGAKVEKEGSTTVPAKQITEVVSQITPGRIELEENEGILKVYTNNFSSTFSTINSTEFPKVPNTFGKDKLKLKKEALGEVAQRVCFSASQDEIKPALSGILFLGVGGEIKVVATDGFRLSLLNLKNQVQNFPKKLIIPARTIDEVVKILEKEEEVGILVLEKENQVLFGTDDIVVTTRLIEGQFPDFEKIIPSSFTTKVVVDKQPLSQAIRLASVFAREAANIVKLSFKNNTLLVSAENPQTGEDQIKLDIKKEGDDLDITFNWRFLSDFLGAVGGEEIGIDLTSETSPAVFRDINNNNFLHLIMPIRIQS